MPARDLKGRVFFTQVRKEGWAEEIDRLIASYDEGDPIIAGGLTVTGHAYWVILEYGSSPKTPNAGPKPGDIVQLKVPFNAPQTSKNHARPYPIRPRKRKMLVFWDHGVLVKRMLVRHPGNYSRGFLRKIIAKVQIALYKELVKLDKGDTLPDREELVALINQHLLFILEAVRAATPIGPTGKYLTIPDDKGHLRDAWGLELAK
jgi:hypothetical protein